MTSKDIIDLIQIYYDALLETTEQHLIAPLVMARVISTLITLNTPPAEIDANLTFIALQVAELV